MTCKASSKLYRNLLPGDKIMVQMSMAYAPMRTHVVTVSHVEEMTRCHISGKRQWVVYGDYPWWFRGPIIAYHEDRVILVYE